MHDCVWIGTPPSTRSLGFWIRSSYADWWLNAKLTGELGAKLIGKNSEKEHRWRLGHVNRFLGGYRLDSANDRFDRVDPR